MPVALADGSEVRLTLANIQSWANEVGREVPANKEAVTKEMQQDYIAHLNSRLPPPDPRQLRMASDPEPNRVKASDVPVGAPKVAVNATQKKDIKAKVSLFLSIPTAVFKTRDPYCGKAIDEQIPEISDALLDIICDSKDLVNFFTGPGGSFMKYLKLATALQPVGEMVWSHHVSHSVGNKKTGDGGPATLEEMQTRYHAPAL